MSFNCVQYFNVHTKKKYYCKHKNKNFEYMYIYIFYFVLTVESRDFVCYHRFWQSEKSVVQRQCGNINKLYLFKVKPKQQQ